MRQHDPSRRQVRVFAQHISLRGGDARDPRGNDWVLGPDRESLIDGLGHSHSDGLYLCRASLSEADPPIAETSQTTPRRPLREVRVPIAREWPRPCHLRGVRPDPDKAGAPRRLEAVGHGVGPSPPPPRVSAHGAFVSAREASQSARALVVSAHASCRSARTSR